MGLLGVKDSSLLTILKISIHYLYFEVSAEVLDCMTQMTILFYFNIKDKKLL
jgi:hypothetical protein